MSRSDFPTYSNLKGWVTIKQKSKYKYTLNQDVIYLGKLYAKYHKKFAIIKSRKKQNRIEHWYTIEFTDGFTLNVKENWITAIQIEMEDI